MRPLTFARAMRVFSDKAEDSCATAKLFKFKRSSVAMQYFILVSATVLKFATPGSLNGHRVRERGDHIRPASFAHHFVSYTRISAFGLPRTETKNFPISGTNRPVPVPGGRRITRNPVIVIWIFPLENLQEVLLGEDVHAAFARVVEQVVRVASNFIGGDLL